jgi:hypothetical protein
MAIQLRSEDRDVYRVDIVGRLRGDEFAACQRELATAIGYGRTVRLLIVLQAFEGWDGAETWRDLSFFVKYGNAIDRIAIVGEDVWRGAALMFAGADLRKADVEYFEQHDLAAARAWLAA